MLPRLALTAEILIVPQEMLLLDQFLAGINLIQVLAKGKITRLRHRVARYTIRIATLHLNSTVYLLAKKFKTRGLPYLLQAGPTQVFRIIAQTTLI